MFRDLRVHIICVEWLHDRAANLYLLFGTDLPRNVSHTAAASAISYFRGHTVLKILNIYFQMLAGIYTPSQMTQSLVYIL